MRLIMAQKHPPQWNLERFLKTLNYFGEIPFLGSIRWLQQLFGATTIPHPAMTHSTSQTTVLVIETHSGLCIQLASRLRDRGYAVSSVKPDQAIASLESGAAPNIQALVIDLETGSTLSESLLSTAAEQLRTGSLSQRQILFDFRQPTSEVQSIWGALDDVVMGGVSESGIQVIDGAARFAGEVSTANSGGFASVRTRNFEPPFNLSASQGLELRVKGDGKRYKFILRNSSGWDSPSYCYSFDTVPQAWTTVQVPFSELIPTFRAKTMEDAPAFNPSQIVSFQLMLSKFEYDRALNPKFEAGPFQLDIATIQAYGGPSMPQVVLIGSNQNEQFEQTTEWVKASGLSYVALRYPQLDTAAPKHSLKLYQAAAPEEPLRPDEVAEAIAQVLQQPGPGNSVLTIGAAPATE